MDTVPGARKEREMEFDLDLAWLGTVRKDEIRRFVIKEWNESDPNPGWTCTEDELKRRFIEATQTIIVDHNTNEMVNWYEVLPVLLHGEGEQLHKNIESLAKFANDQLDHPPDEWERWVEIMPELDWSNQDKFKQWFLEMGRIIREMPRGK